MRILNSVLSDEYIYSFLILLGQFLLHASSWMLMHGSFSLNSRSFKHVDVAFSGMRQYVACWIQLYTHNLSKPNTWVLQYSTSLLCAFYNRSNHTSFIWFQISAYRTILKSKHMCGEAFLWIVSCAPSLWSYSHRCIFVLLPLTLLLQQFCWSLSSPGCILLVLLLSFCPAQSAS